MRRFGKHPRGNGIPRKTYNVTPNQNLIGFNQLLYFSFNIQQALNFIVLKHECQIPYH